MKKFECKDCSRNCKIEYNPKGTEDCLYFCVKADVATHWHEVKEDSAKTEQFGNSEQLPDWVKVGAFCYNKTHKKYGQITRIQYDMLFDVINFDNTKSICGVGIFSEEYVQAHKRPFNEAEMKALVGKVITDVEGDATLITDFDNVTKNIRFLGEWWKSDELADSTWKLDGKPCYKLEHLNEKGEWVE